MHTPIHADPAVPILRGTVLLGFDHRGAAAALVVAAVFAVQADRGRDEPAAERDRSGETAQVLAARTPARPPAGTPAAAASA
ncbi:hypothetical protein [Streptomyces sp. JW3]|uniref:hypothetical protein n=1 Tax=Streptomyces sp. JW3 TaxID=3456955 RepID=UPI003FA40EF2